MTNALIYIDAQIIGRIASVNPLTLQRQFRWMRPIKPSNEEYIMAHRRGAKNAYSVSGSGDEPTDPRRNELLLSDPPPSPRLKLLNRRERDKI